ncbi:hypothetical protein J6590_040728 [Homalodisca vitripennis]|nr:hypothetical protein J6590_040728 [Homalodisca vitripennis]
MNEVLGDAYVACVALLLANKTYEVEANGRKIANNVDCGTYRTQQLKDELAEVVAEMENMDTADDRMKHECFLWRNVYHTVFRQCRNYVTLKQRISILIDSVYGSTSKKRTNFF